VAGGGRSEGERSGVLKGKIEGKIDSLILALKERFGTLPPDLGPRIRTSMDSGQLDYWMRAAISLSVKTLEEFRQRAGL
jgi:hypothetical protein